MLLSFLTFPLETDYLIMYWTDLQQIFRISTHMGGYDQYDLHLAITQKRCHANRFVASISENMHTQPSFCALALHNKW